MRCRSALEARVEMPFRLPMASSHRRAQTYYRGDDDGTPQHCSRRLADIDREMNVIRRRHIAAQMAHTDAHMYRHGSHELS